MLVTGWGTMVKVLAKNHHGGGVGAYVLVLGRSSRGSVSVRGGEQGPDGR